jgi:endonuclease YncB( thermonuclease family)
MEETQEQLQLNTDVPEKEEEEEQKTVSKTAVTVLRKVGRQPQHKRLFPHQRPNPTLRIPRGIKWSDTKEFVIPIKEGRVIKVYDGDTITIAGTLPYKNSPIYRVSVRLNGIDTPEMRTNDEDERRVAEKAKYALSKLILKHWVVLRNRQREKYGRLLAEVYLGGLNVNRWMIEHRYAVPYDGGTKHVPKSWVAYHSGRGLDIDNEDEGGDISPVVGEAVEESEPKLTEEA